MHLLLNLNLIIGFRKVNQSLMINLDCKLLASRTVNLQDFFGMIFKIVGVVYFETLLRKAGVPSRLIF